MAGEDRHALGDATSGGKAAAGAATPLLEQFQNVVVGEDPQKRVFEVRPCGCDSWYCADCCERKGYKLRSRLIPVLETFTGIMMLTLTIDPTLFGSPRDAYFHVRAKRGISELIRRLVHAGHLHSRRYFCVLEFQKDTEQAHFHALVDATRIPKRALDDAWSRLRPRDAGPPSTDRPAFGMTRFSKPTFESALHAARYATKYLVKAPRYGWPGWVMALGAEKRVPRYQASRGFWGESRKRPAKRTVKKRTATPRSYEERTADCGVTSNLFELGERIDESTGEVQPLRLWKSRLSIEEDRLAALMDSADNGRVSLRIVARNAGECIDAIRRAAGHPVSVIAGACSQEARRS